MTNVQLNWKFYWAWCLALICVLVACSEEGTREAEEGPFADCAYLTGVTAETQLEKADLAARLAQAIGEGFPEALLENLLLDLDIAAITYRTMGVDGEPVTASGLVVFPSGTLSYDHLLSVQHTTVDMEDAPSLQLFSYEMLPVLSGSIVVMADYLGYGASQTADRQHPYLHMRLTGSVCADMIEAAREYLRGKAIAEEKPDVKLMGYSQGGQATVATLMELERRGLANRVLDVQAGGGVYDLEELLRLFLEMGEEGEAYADTGYLPYLIRGMAYGERLDVDERNLYAPEVIEKSLNRMFATQPLSTWHWTLGSDITRVLHPDFWAGASGYGGNTDVERLVDALRRNSLVNQPVPEAPVQLYHSPTDEMVPYANALSARDAWKNATLTDLEMPDHKSAALEFFLRYVGYWEVFGPWLVNR